MFRSIKTAPARMADWAINPDTDTWKIVTTFLAIVVLVIGGIVLAVVLGHVDMSHCTTVVGTTITPKGGVGITTGIAC